MASITHVTGLLIAPPAARGATAAMYLRDTGDGGLLAMGLASARTWPVDHLVVVLGADADTLLDHIGDGVDVLIDPEWGEGPAAALRSGFDLVVRGDRSDAVLVTSLDRVMPGAELVAAVLEVGQTTSRPLVAAKYRYALDHPYLVRPELWGRVLGMEGSASLESLVATHPEWVAETWIDRVPPRRFTSADDLGSLR